MKAIMVMFDSLNRRMLAPYGCDWVHTPNFSRLAENSVTFSNSYVGSMGCMPARREIHTGRYNFLHRSWGPIEPFDDSMPQMLAENGVHTHLATDHYHYWQDGGATYHTRYKTHEFFRGQEGDAWKGDLSKPNIPNPNPSDNAKYKERDWINRSYMQNEENQPQPKTFKSGIEFIETNHLKDNWYLQIETFDPHEPFFCNQKYKDLYPHDYKGPLWDWPNYERVTQSKEEVQHMRYQYAALVSMCDHYLGKVLDIMDKYNLWKDTLLIVNTDHGYILGEHGWWGKMKMPFFNEVANTPLFIWDPRNKKKNEYRNSLVQTIDLAPTILDYFGVNIPKDMQGKTLKETINDDTSIRETGLFGVHGGQVNCTDGRYVYMRAPCEQNFPLYQYTLMPTNMAKMFTIKSFQTMTISKPFSFTKGCPVMKIDASGGKGKRFFDDSVYETLLFDTKNDSKQEEPIKDKKIEEMMMDHTIKLMKENDSPEEQFERLGLKK